MYRDFETLNVNAEVDIHPDINFWLHEAQGLDEHEKFIYFYHKDHLGSSTQITDLNADVIHHIEYMPYGETFFEKRSHWATRYKFNAKEKDEETGLYYYGARYYTPDLSVWLSVDPMADKYPSTSPYAYVENNPIMFIDLNGMNKDEYNVNITTGEITKVSNLGGDKFDVFNVSKEHENGGQTLVKQYMFDKNENGLINMEDNEYGINTHGGSGIYMSPKAAGSMLGVIETLGYNDLSLGNFSKSDGSSPPPSVSHKNGNVGDLRPLRTDQSGNPVTVFDNQFDLSRNTELVKTLNKFGWSDILSERNKKGNLVPGTRHYSKSRHHNHFHIQGFNPDFRISPNFKKW
jgi:RHS repeat-associated protein